MLPLREFQAEFRRALFEDAVTDGLAASIHAGGIAVERRLKVYRNNMMASLSSSLRATYPAIHRLLGDDPFAALARRYVLEHPSTNGDLHRFGAEFARFLSTRPELAELPYLPDTARLEWAYHRVFHAAEKQPITARRLAELDPADFPRLCFELHPASRLLYSKYPLPSIWRLAVHGDRESSEVRLDEGEAHLMVARRGLEMEFQTLADDEYAFLLQLDAGMSLERCCEAVAREFPAFDLQSRLNAQFEKRNLTGFSLRDA